jgi:hypothetical protein
MIKKNKTILLSTLFVLMHLYSSAQISSPINFSIDTLYLSSGSMTPSIDSNPSNNPFLTDSAGGFSRGIVANDDPGGPGSGGGGFDPPADAAIPLDGGVAGLVLAGALIGLKRTKKEKNLL